MLITRTKTGCVGLRVLFQFWVRSWSVTYAVGRVGSGQ